MNLRGSVKRRSLGLRITIAFVATAVVLTGILSAATLITVRALVEDQRIRSSTRQTLFAVLFAREFLSARTDPEELVSRLQIRQRFDAMVTSGEDWFATSLDLTPDAVPDGLRGLVTQERFGYEVTRLGDHRVLVYGSPLPPAGTDLYAFFPLEDIDRTMSILGRALGIIAIVVLVLMVFVARRLSAGILQPLGVVSGAAQRMAEGLLDTRVEATSSDELGQLAQSFNRMAEALRDMIQHERHFVAAVSHELRTPLAALNAAVEVVVRGSESLAPEAREAVQLVREDLAALQQLVSELMEVSELDSGRATVRAEEVRPRTLVEALLHRRRREAVVEGDDPVIVTDKSRLERIVGNLIDNAFTHGEGRGVTVSIVEHDDACLINVSDLGPGIAPDDMSQLFRRFYKPDRARTRERGGVGLGLAIAQENARLLGGSVGVSSAGEQTTFTVTLPSRTKGEQP